MPFMMFIALSFAFTALGSATASAQTATAPLTTLIEQNYQRLENGQPVDSPFTVDAVMAPDLEEVIATGSPVPKTGEQFANSAIIIRCTDKQGNPIPTRNGATDRQPRYITITGSLTGAQIGTDTAAYESNMLPQFVLLVDGCAVTDRVVAPEQAVAERTIALLNTKALYPGPTFNCPDIQKCGPLAQAIVAESYSAFGLGLVDIALVQPYQVLRHATPDNQKALREQASRFAQTVEKSCRLPPKFKPDDVHGNLIGTDRFAPCIKAAYEKQRLTWLTDVRNLGLADAMEEASRPARDHYTLQLLLAYHGLMAPDARIDGSYGAGTRNAIITLQKEANLPTSGFLSNATAEFLLKKQDNPR